MQLSDSRLTFSREQNIGSLLRQDELVKKHHAVADKSASANELRPMTACKRGLEHDQTQRISRE
jgi:hypothetical protein